MNKLNRQTVETITYPERILQFGEGNFLRTFIDWIINNMNKETDFKSSVVAVQPIEHGLAELINAQDGLYHIQLKGIKDGKATEKTELIDCISRAINPYSQTEDYQKLVISEDLQFVVSNTTEAGISWKEEEFIKNGIQDSFPAKITNLLFKRFETFDGDTEKGLVFFCCELIENNASKLKELVLKHTSNWDLGEEFTEWINSSCKFCNTLVDRIVPGYPKNNIKEIQQEIGYEDHLVSIGELFHLWVVEADEEIAKRFPANKLSSDIKFVESMKTYREQKVKILNGTHTASMALSRLNNVETVQDSVEHKVLGDFMKIIIESEIAPTIVADEKDLEVYASKIIERFHNPFIRHEWKSISLNSISKWTARDLPTLKQYKELKGEVPKLLSLSLSALILYYKSEFNGLNFELLDDQENIDFFTKTWESYSSNGKNLIELIHAILSNNKIWQEDLTKIEGLEEQVLIHIINLMEKGVETTINELIK
jgi:tagaturonate reductase